MRLKNILIIGVCAAVVLVSGFVIYNKVKISVDRNEKGSAVTIIGGADGATSVFLAGKLGESESVAEYKSITMEEAKKIFAEAGDYIILDVRTADEFAGGHIPGAMNLANEEIGSKRPVELPDVNKDIYVYCRSGRRSKEAAAKLAALGYTGVIECGGILDWTGEMEE